MTPQQNIQVNSFQGLGIAPGLLSALDANNFTIPTPIQAKAIPVAIEGKDLVGIAQTGTGKTLAFGVPMMQRISQLKARGLVVLPTRELALQVDETLRKLGKLFNLRTTVLIGGASMSNQIYNLRSRPHIIIATPGRLNDHLEQRTLKLDEVKVLVLDEADRMLDMGFAPQINKIITALPKERQTLLFSATMPSAIMNMAKEYMKLPLRIEVAPAGTTADKITQEIYVVKKEEKERLLDKLLVEFRGSVLIFSRTKHGAKKITQSIRNMGHTTAEIHANRSLAQRKMALEGFKNGKYRVLVATDIAARGIDVNNIELVINYDLPDNPDDYVHRIGRTGRAGKSGQAISFATPEQRSEVRTIEKLIRATLPVKQASGLPPSRPKLPQEAVPFGERNQFKKQKYGRNNYGRGTPRAHGTTQAVAHSGAHSAGHSPSRNGAHSATHGTAHGQSRSGGHNATYGASRGPSRNGGRRDFGRKRFR